MTHKPPSEQATRKIQQLHVLQQKAKTRKPKQKRTEEQVPLFQDIDAELIGVPEVVTESAAEKPKRGRKPKAKATELQDLFAPMLYDVSARDHRAVMDVAPFRLSKRDTRANEVILYELDEGTVTITSGPAGMASVFDYDLVLMGISTLTEAMNQYRDKPGAEKPGRKLTPQLVDIIKFCRKENGGNQREAIGKAIDRLMGTKVTINRPRIVDGKQKWIDESFTLINDAKVVSSGDDRKVEYVEFALPSWMYDDITSGDRPDVLTMHPDYFSHESGIARFIYRFARRTAGKTSSTWSFENVYSRSGSTGDRKGFYRNLRKVIAANDVPEYDLAEVPGKDGPMLSMVKRSSIEHLKG
jgi:hypothetical protein